MHLFPDLLVIQIPIDESELLIQSIDLLLSRADVLVGGGQVARPTLADVDVERDHLLLRVLRLEAYLVLLINLRLEEELAFSCLAALVDRLLGCVHYLFRRGENHEIDS